MRKKLFIFITVFMTLHGAWAVVDGTPKEKEELAQLIQQRQALEKETNDALENGVGVYDFDKLLDNTGKIEHKIDEYRKRGVTTYQEDKEDEEFWAGKWGWDDDMPRPFYSKKEHCIHVSDFAFKAITAVAIRAKCKGNCDVLLEGALNLFYKEYLTDRAEICLNTLRDICLLATWNKDYCSNYRADIANSMVFTTENFDERFINFALPDREARTLIEIAVKKDCPQCEVYCDNKKEQNFIDVFNCKLVDGETFSNRSFVFSGARYAYPQEGKNIVKDAKKVRENLTSAGNAIWWPNRETVLDVQPISEGNKANVWGIVQDAGAAECNKYNDIIKKYFGGYAKMEPVPGDDGASKDDKMVCVTQWYPSSVKRKTVNRDFDKRGFKTSYANFIDYEDVQDTDMIIKYLEDAAQQSGKVLTDIHCDNTPGVYKNVKISGLLLGKQYVLDTDKAYFFRCYGTYNGKQLVEDFVFKWREKTTYIDKSHRELYIYSE